MKADARQYGELSGREKNAYDSIIGLLPRSTHADALHLQRGRVHHRPGRACQCRDHRPAGSDPHESYSYVLASITDLPNQNRVFELARTHPTIIKRNAPIMGAYDDFMREKTARPC